MIEEENYLAVAIKALKESKNPLFIKKSNQKVVTRIKKNKQFASIVKKKKNLLNHSFKNILAMADKLNIQDDLVKQIKNKRRSFFQF